MRIAMQEGAILFDARMRPINRYICSQINAISAIQQTEYKDLERAVIFVERFS